MSTCISRAGEFGSHHLGTDHVCFRCGVLNEDALIAELNQLRGERDSLRDTVAGLERQANRIFDAYQERLAERDRMRPVVEAAESLVADWKADRSTHGHILIVAVDAYRNATTIGAPEGGLVLIASEWLGNEGRTVIADALKDHLSILDGGSSPGWRCECGEWSTPYDFGPMRAGRQHRQHVADAIVAAIHHRSATTDAPKESQP